MTWTDRGATLPILAELFRRLEVLSYEFYFRFTASLLYGRGKFACRWRHGQGSLPANHVLWIFHLFGDRYLTVFRQPYLNLLLCVLLWLSRTVPGSGSDLINFDVCCPFLTWKYLQYIDVPRLYLPNIIPWCSLWDGETKLILLLIVKGGYYVLRLLMPYSCGGIRSIMCWLNHNMKSC